MKRNRKLSTLPPTQATFHEIQKIRNTKSQTIEVVSELREAGLLRIAALDFALPSTHT